MGWQSDIFNLLIVAAGAGFSGEFVYTPAPGPGNLVYSNTGAAGTDPYGNTYLAGSSWYSPGGVINIPLNSSAILVYAPTAAMGDLDVSLAAAAGTDAYGNTYPAGLHWAAPIQTMPGMSNGWSVGGHAKYTLDPLGNLVVSWKDLIPGADTDGTVIWGIGSLPAAYQPGNNRRIACYTDQARITGTYSEGAALEIEPDGSVQCYGIAAGATRVDLFAVIPLSF